MLKAILFDLDGTLLPMDQDTFVNAYFTEILKKFVPLGYDGKKLTKNLWEGTKAMIENDGKKTNEEVFWDLFKKDYKDLDNEKKLFDSFYENEFNEVKKSCGYDPEAKFAIKEIKNMGLRTILATNPVFPRVCTYNRLSWTGLNNEDFEYISTYENSRFCKPNPLYFQEIIEKLGLKPEECLMVGNDCNEDYSATKINIPFFLITRNIINKTNIDISTIPHGTFFDLLNYLNEIR